MQNREFENKVQGKMEELKLAPADAVWDKVEASLPKEKKRRWVIFILLFAVLITGGLFVWNGLDKNLIHSTTKGTGPKEEAKQEAVAMGTSIESKRSADTIAAFPTTTDNRITSTNLDKNKKEILHTRTRIKIKSPSEDALPDSKDEKYLNSNPKELITKAGTKVKVKKPEVDINEEVMETADNAPGVIMKDTINNVPATVFADPVASIKKDTAITSTKDDKKKKKSNSWHYGIELAGGTSNVKSNLFSNAQVYADRFSSTMSFPGGGNPVSTSPNKPARNAGLTAGLYAEKSISQKWTFKTGLNYLYQSNTIKVGKKIDSVINFSLDINKSLTASSYYRTGDSVSYKNNFHLLEIPLIFQYQFSKSPHFYLEAGPSITYLLQSNALVYSSRSQAYVTDKDIFNKLGVSFNGGAAIDLARRSTFPFSIGYRFKYSMGSVVKASFGKQHFINSFLYLKIPFKK